MNKINIGIQSRLIFLISMPRSGSTLLQKILDGIPEIETTGEPWIMLPLLNMYNTNTINIYSEELADRAKDELFKELEFDDEVILNAQRAYADTIYEKILDKKGSKYFLDKTPRYIYILNELKRLYPNAKFITLLRNPKNVIASYATTWNNGSFGRLLKDPLSVNDFQVGFKKLAVFLTANHVNNHIIRFEDLLDNPEEVVSGLCSYLNVEYDSDLINYGKRNTVNKVYAFGDPNTVYTHKTINKKSKLSWIKTLKDSHQLKLFQKCLSLIEADVPEKLGYEECDRDTVIKILTNKRNKHIKYDKKIYLVTPTFNSEQTIERTIRSVLNLRFPDTYTVHYHIQDGGSSDSTMNIIDKYSKLVEEQVIEFPQLVFSSDSHKDRGMYDAIAKAFNQFVINDDDSWMAWINSDDFLSNDVLMCLSEIDSLPHYVSWVTGNHSTFSKEFEYNNDTKLHFSEAIKNGLAEGKHMSFIQQEGTFFKKNLWDFAGGSLAFDGFKLAGDWNLWRIFAQKEILFVANKPLGYFCQRDGQLSQRQLTEYYAEIDKTVSDQSRLNALRKLAYENFMCHVIDFRSDNVEISNVSVDDYLKIWRNNNGLS